MKPKKKRKIAYCDDLVLGQFYRNRFNEVNTPYFVKEHGRLEMEEFCSCGCTPVLLSCRLEQALLGKTR